MIALIFVLSPVGRAQRSVSELSATHAASLERYMSENKNLKFRHEQNLDNDYLQSMRETFGKNFKPNYAVADFNRDKIKDFAVLLYREGKAVPNRGITSKEHATDYPLRLVVFNGTKGGFRVAYSKDLQGPDAAFIAFSTRKLYYGIYETDSDTFILAPSRRGYTMKFEGLD